MAGSLEGAEGDAIPLTYNSAFGTTDLTVTARIFSVAGAQVGSNVSLTHVANGLYQSSFTIPAGNDYLSVIYFESGDDEATAVDTIKVRSLSPFGSGGASAGGVTEDDIKEIIKGVNAKNVWEEKLSSGRTAGAELVAKSEFNFEENIVKTDIVIPKVNLESIKRFIRITLDSFVKSIPSTKKVETEFKKLSNSINAIEIPIIDFTEINQKIDKLHGEELKMIQSIEIPVTDLSEVNKSIELLKPVIEKVDNQGMIKDLVNFVEKQVAKINQKIEALPKDNTSILTSFIKKESDNLVGNLNRIDKKLINENIINLIRVNTDRLLDDVEESKELLKDSDELQLQRLEKLILFLHETFTRVLSRIVEAANRGDRTEVLDAIDELKGLQLNVQRV